MSSKAGTLKTLSGQERERERAYNDTYDVRLSGAWRSWQAFPKRALDIVGSLVLLAALSPVILVAAIAIRLDSPGPIIFRQRRCGKDGRVFTFLKFRGMYADAEARRATVLHLNESTGPLFKMKNDPRVTRVGRIIRRTSIDEIPQLLNVLRGDMSLVGPRPALPSEVERYESLHLQRLAVRPGITGLWQVRGRSTVGFEAMIAYDLDYIARWTIGLDVFILLKTIVVVASTKGAY